MIPKFTEKPRANKSQPLAHVDDYLVIAQQAGASDIHLGVNAPPIWRLHGTLQPIWPDASPLTAQDTKTLAESFLTDSQKKQLDERGDADFAYANSSGRFRTSVVRQRLGVDLVFRIINTKVHTMDELGLPEHLKLLTRYQNGLILVTGSVGSGKSTTLAALVDQINSERREQIITLEDPIEYILEPKGCHITQREVHTHTRSFAAALRGALREDPDVIMVGEMRDLETISLAITASETGHLVLGTLHTSNASRTLDRLLDVFPPDQQDQIRVMVSESLRGVIIGVEMEVLNELKPGLDEKLYERAMTIELKRRGHEISVQRSFPVFYRGELIGNLLPDLIVDDIVIVDPKVVNCFTEAHVA